MKVEPSALGFYASLVDRAREDSVTISDYVKKNAAAGTGGEFFAIARDGHEQAVSTIQGTLYRLSCMLEYSAPELRAASKYYKETDAASAIRLDQTLPAGVEQCPTILEYEISSNACQPGMFLDSRDAPGRLKPPGEPDKPPNKLAWFDYISPTSWMLKGFETVFGFDPVAEVQNKIFGDWEAMAKMSEVVSNSDLALHDLAVNVQSGATQLHTYWQGNAGDTAYRYFTDLATAIENLRPSLKEIADGYKIMADAVWAAGDALGGVIKAICDSAIIAGIAAAGGTATAATGVGAVVGYGVAAVEVANMLRLWGEATKLLQNINAAVLAFRALLNRSLSDLNSVKLPTIGGGAGYDHPLTGAGAHA
ncbi:hypothetical protein OWR29_39095 [Actinoplanes sp. Pm04-4]|uniref:Uncharacterized protein n=1 Tax=Paractinoplanes pyxinae TaxID=2997416 RepID=A0ABT4BBZ9_9ACTN|nr:hypothetical protein [Actinoplanes pyxinae]MCY1144038.1 hypothetical protein [Actinoplanes pyxinae]